MKKTHLLILEVVAGAAVALYTGDGLNRKINRLAQAAERVVSALERIAYSTEHGGLRRPSTLPVISQPPAPDDCAPKQSKYDFESELRRADREIYERLRPRLTPPDFTHVPNLPTLGGAARDIDCRDRIGVPIQCPEAYK